MSRETPEQELERLIRQQGQDLSEQDYQRPEPGAVHLSDLEELVNQDGELQRDLWDERTRRAVLGCKIHGVAHMEPSYPSWTKRGIAYYCTECNRERVRQYRALHKPWKRPEKKERNHQEYLRRKGKES